MSRGSIVRLREPLYSYSRSRTSTTAGHPLSWVDLWAAIYLRFVDSGRR